MQHNPAFRQAAKPQGAPSASAVTGTVTGNVQLNIFTQRGAIAVACRPPAAVAMSGGSAAAPLGWMCSVHAAASGAPCVQGAALATHVQ